MKLTVNIQPPYVISIESSLLAQLGKHVKAEHIALISDENVAKLYGEQVRTSLTQQGKTVKSYTVPAGEGSKTPATHAQLLSQMAQDQFDRTGAVLALGGGIVGDLAGYVAASYMRGIDFYQCPTSLLAMVDASVGGKTGVNLPEGKNLVGAFWQPKAVFIDPVVLLSLSSHEFRQGAVELFKHGLLADERILEKLPSDTFHAKNQDLMTKLIFDSVAVKARIVEKDEKERGERAFLNLGHNLAHALEAASHNRIPHGDAVSYGLLFSSKLSSNRAWVDETSRILAFHQWLNPVELGIRDFHALKPYMDRDKKNIGKRQHFVLLKELGKPVLVDDLSVDELQKAWQYLLEVSA